MWNNDLRCVGSGDQLLICQLVTGVCDNQELLFIIDEVQVVIGIDVRVVHGVVNEGAALHGVVAGVVVVVWIAAFHDDDRDEVLVA